MDLNRREFVTLTIGTVAAAAACGSLCTGSAEAAEAPAAAGASEPVDVGALSSFDTDKVIDTFAAKERFLLVRADGKLVAPSAACTHKNCRTPLFIKGDELACKCHGSKFTPAGIVTKGPAKNSLYHYGISVNDKGHVLVDKSKQFSEKDWEKDGAFVEIKKA